MNALSAPQLKAPGLVLKGWRYPAYPPWVGKIGPRAPNGSDGENILSGKGGIAKNNSSQKLDRGGAGIHTYFQ
jgi:hypothetical protein